MLVNISVKKLDNSVRNTIEDKATSPSNSSYKDNKYNSKYYNKLEYNKDSLPFTYIDIEELKLILYKYIIILIVKVKDYLVLAIFLIVIYIKREDRKL